MGLDKNVFEENATTAFRIYRKLKWVNYMCFVQRVANVILSCTDKNLKENKSFNQVSDVKERKVR